MKKLKKIDQIVNTSPYFSLISMKIKEAGKGYSIVEIDINKDKHLQPLGVVHGGVFASLIDTAAAWSVFFNLEKQNKVGTSVDLKLNFLAPAVSGKLIAKGNQIKLGKTLAYAEATVTNEDEKILAHGTSTMIIKDREYKY